MPFQCTKCFHLSRTEENQNCENRKECNLIQVSIIHYASPNGTGKLIGTGTRTTIEEGKTVVVAADLRLCCDSENPQHITSSRYAVSCLDCLERSKPDPVPTPVLDPDLSILS